MGYVMALFLLLLGLFIVADAKSFNDNMKRFYDHSGYPLKNGEVIFLSANGLILRIVKLNKHGTADDWREFHDVPESAALVSAKNDKGVVLYQHSISAFEATHG